MGASTTPAAAGSNSGSIVKQTFGHPDGLFILFFTEMWERFSYYGMRGMLVLYMTSYLFVGGRSEHVAGFDTIQSALSAVFGTLSVQALSSQLYGIYTGLVYFTPFFGGILADRILGQRKTVVVGGLLMALGHFLMAFERLFFLALFLLILGNGCFKPNISTQVGALYPPGDSRRDSAFSIFYVGINIGAFLSNLVCASLGMHYGWHYGFGAAGVGMCIGVIVFLAGRKYLAPETREKKQAEGPVSKPAPFTKAEWNRIIGLVALCALNIVFWAVYEQQGNTMQLWAEHQTVWPTIFGWTIPSPWFQSFNPFMIFTLTPLVTWYWDKQALSGKEPSSVAKMAIGCMILGFSFLVMVVASQVVGTGKGSLFWLVACTLMLTIGELYLSPVGLSLVTKVSPPRIVSMMMGMWFLSSFFGNYLSGFIGSFYERMPKTAFFLLLTSLGIGAGFAMFAFNKPLKRALAQE